MRIGARTVAAHVAELAHAGIDVARPSRRDSPVSRFWIASGTSRRCGESERRFLPKRKSIVIDPREASSRVAPRATRDLRAWNCVATMPRRVARPCTLQPHPAGRRPSAKGEAKGGKGKKLKRQQRTDERGLRSEPRQCSCNCRRIIVATSRRHPCRRSAARCGVNSRALRKGRSPDAYYSIAPPPPPSLLLASHRCYSSNHLRFMARLHRFDAAIMARIYRQIVEHNCGI